VGLRWDKRGDLPDVNRQFQFRKASLAGVLFYSDDQYRYPVKLALKSDNEHIIEAVCIIMLRTRLSISLDIFRTARSKGECR